MIKLSKVRKVSLPQMKELFRDQSSLASKNLHVSENGLTRKLPFVQSVIRKILKSQSINHFDQEDIAQETIQALLAVDHETIENLNERDWWYFIRKILARKRTDLYRRNQIQNHSVELTEKADVPANDLSVAGNTDYEAYSLAKQYWEKIPELTLRQKFAVLTNEEFLRWLIKLKVCTRAEIARELNLELEVYDDVMRQGPYQNKELGTVFERLFLQKMTGSQVSDHRLAAIKKLKKIENG